ncbi:MAG: cytochrome c-type biogenesis protein CcmH [Rhodocyclaceae bacterium]
MHKTLVVMALALTTLTAAASDDADIDARVMALSEDLRCVVCQNQSIAESNAGLALDLRREIRAMLVAGKDENDVRHFLTDRYGDFILYDPPFKASTLLLWAGPGVLLIGALAALARTLRQRTQRERNDAGAPR